MPIYSIGSVMVSESLQRGRPIFEMSEFLIETARQEVAGDRLLATSLAPWLFSKLNYLENHSDIPLDASYADAPSNAYFSAIYK